MDQPLLSGRAVPPFLLPREFVRSPEALVRSYDLEGALAYCKWLATTHYENFHVVSVLLPRRLHQDFFNVYAFCRWADDLGDEIGNPAESLSLLAWWKEQLDAMYRGQATHPVYLALRETVRRHALPSQPFHDLIQAFVQDQKVKRYDTWTQLFEYCRYSANPVGRLVLSLCGYSDEPRQNLSDATCTALQLANHWQDISVDLDKDRVYLPRELLERHGSSVDEVLQKRATANFRMALQEAVEVARRLFHQGLPLAQMVNRRLAVDIELFSRGGMRILDKIERQGYDVFARRPSISRLERFWLLAGTVTRVALRRTV
jgi:squalene synthase HpnC